MRAAEEEKTQQTDLEGGYETLKRNLKQESYVALTEGVGRDEEGNRQGSTPPLDPKPFELSGCWGEL